MDNESTYEIETNVVAGLYRCNYYLHHAFLEHAALWPGYLGQGESVPGFQGVDTRYGRNPEYKLDTPMNLFDYKDYVSCRDLKYMLMLFFSS